MLCRYQITCMNFYWPMCDVYVVVSRSFLLVSLPFEQLLIVLYCVNISLLEYLSRSFIHTSNMPNILYLQLSLIFVIIDLYENEMKYVRFRVLTTDFSTKVARKRILILIFCRKTKRKVRKYNIELNLYYDFGIN